MKWIQNLQGTLILLRIDLVDFIILSGWLQPEFQTKAEVFTEKIDMSVTG
jgi:hypothetical protein